MCCRCRNRRGPLVVIAAQAAYGKYHEHQLKKQRPELDALPAPAPMNDAYTTPRIIHQHDEKQDFLMNLETSGIQLPSYDEVVVNRAEIPGHSPTDSVYAAGVQQAAEEFVTNWKRERSASASSSEGEKDMTWWETKKAAKQAKKEAKCARKAAKWEAKGKRKGCCC